MTDDRERKRRYWKVEPAQTARFAYPKRCPDERCGEDVVIAVPHPKDPEQQPNRCPTCFGTVSD